MLQREAVVDILGVRVAALDVRALLGEIAQQIELRGHAIFANVNVHALNIAFTTPWFRDFLNASTLVFCDGAGVMLGARLVGRRLPQRITYADWIWQLAKFAASRGYTVFFLGARPGVAQQAAERLCERFAGLRVVGVHHGYFDRTPRSEENEAIIREINAAQPDILVVGFGMPLQEHWLMENWERIDALTALTGGAVFDYASGTLRRAPRWMADHGLEWLGRLFIEPRRLWRRYLIGNPLFLIRVVRQRLGWLPSGSH